MQISERVRYATHIFVFWSAIRIVGQVVMVVLELFFPLWWALIFRQAELGRCRRAGKAIIRLRTCYRRYFGEVSRTVASRRGVSMCQSGFRPVSLTFDMMSDAVSENIKLNDF